MVFYGLENEDWNLTPERQVIYVTFGLGHIKWHFIPYGGKKVILPDWYMGKRQQLGGERTLEPHTRLPFQ